MKRASPLLLALGLLLGFGLTELGVRAAGVEWTLLEPLVPRQVSDPELYHPVVEPTLYALKPGLDLTLDNGSPWTNTPRHVRTNTLGLRDPEREEDGRPRVLCVGGSHTFGPAVSDDETWPAALERSLAARGVEVQAWNAGVSGYMNRQKVALAQQLMQAQRFDLVLFQVYNEGRRFTLVDTPLPWRLRVSPDLYAEYVAGAPEPGEGWLFWRSALVRVLFIGQQRLRLRSPATDPTMALIERARALDAQALLDFVAWSPTPVVVLLPPRGGEVPPGVALIDLYDMEVPFGDEGRDIHPGPRVYAWEAERVAEALIARGDLDRE
ncbi:MAG: hypothetical protein H6741_34720 [Alphaproteobacteria bacterium]|nr:hypothetical protein [Alphaproteobacteria bacterium]